jgi:ABC-2 type transport system ATP-binding protein
MYKGVRSVRVMEGLNFLNLPGRPGARLGRDSRLSRRLARPPVPPYTSVVEREAGRDGDVRRSNEAGLSAIQVRDLAKTYVVSLREAGIRAALAGVFHRRTQEVHAVDGISFDLAPGEIVGFLGPNGAGKTTTLKMLSGLLHPTSGGLSVLGHTPWKRERAFLRQITLVMGQRNQLVWDIPASDSFELNRAIYRIPLVDYRRTLEELTALLELGELLAKPVRNLSLGERMKCEIAAALLHSPQVVFLDEPTIGLDVTMQRRIRSFIAEYNRRTGATVLLTSHYMADVEALCRRVIVIHRGRLLFDGELASLVRRYTAHKTIVVQLDRAADLASYGEVVSEQDGRVTLRVPKAETARVTGRLLADLPVTDLTVEDPPIEEVIEQVFAGGPA